MTGDHDDREEELEFDQQGGDEEFVLDDWDEVDGVLADVQSEVERQSGLASGQGSESPLFVLDDGAESDDPLYGGLSAGVAGPVGGGPETMGLGGAETPEDVLFGTPSSRAPRAAKFGEPGSDQWGGSGMSADDIGIPVEEHAGKSSSFDKLEGLEDAVDIDGDGDGATEDPWHVELGAGHLRQRGAADDIPEKVAVSAYGFGDEQGAEGGYGEDVEGEGVEGEAEPEYDPIYGAREPGQEEHEELPQAEAEQDYSEYDESYVESGWAKTQRPVRRRLPLRWVGSVAALLVVALGVGTVVMKPEWLGIRGAPPLVERTAFARPNLEIVLPPPAAEVGGAVAVSDPAAGAAPDPVRDPVSDPTPELPTGDPVADPVGPDPVIALPTPEPVPDGPAPVPTWIGPDADPDGVVTIEGYETVEAPPKDRDLVAVGEELRVGQRVAAPNAGTAMQPRALGAGLSAGDQAYAQLHNGNFFLGQVKVFGGQDVTLRVAKGEVTLPFDLLQRLGEINSEEYMNLMRTTPGLVKLTNDNRLMGSIVRAADGKVSLQLEAQRIIIPGAEIEEVTNSMPAGVRVGDDADDAWVHKMIEKRLEKRDAEREHRGDGSATVEPPK